MAGNLDRKLRLPSIHFRVLLHAANMRHATKGFISLPKEGVLRIFSASAGFEPANLGTKGQHATSRPLKPLKITVLQNATTFILLHNYQLLAQACCLHLQGRIHVKVNKTALIASQVCKKELT